MTSRTASLATKRGLPQPSIPQSGDRDEAARLLSLMQVEHQQLRMVDSAGVTANVGETVAARLRELLAFIAEGRVVSIVPNEVPLTTQAAADILNVSRQYLVRLLDNGTIPATKTGTHRRVMLEDVLAYKAKRDVERRKGLKALVELSMEYGGYGDLES
jgi:excisionase family DNA binding protein